MVDAELLIYYSFVLVMMPGARPKGIRATGRVRQWLGHVYDKRRRLRSTQWTWLGFQGVFPCESKLTVRVVDGLDMLLTQQTRLITASVFIPSVAVGI